MTETRGTSGGRTVGYRGAGLHERCISNAVLRKPERVCPACYDHAQHVTGETSAFKLAAWIAEQGIG